MKGTMRAADINSAQRVARWGALLRWPRFGFARRTAPCRRPPPHSGTMPAADILKWPDGHRYASYPEGT